MDVLSFATVANGVVVAACLRNASAVEDLLGAGAVLAALAECAVFEESPEAAWARAACALVASVPEAVRRCASGVELAELGFGADVEVAVEMDVSDVVPVLKDGAFRSNAMYARGTQEPKSGQQARYPL